MYYSVMVVEDEKIQRKLFVQTIDWRAYQCEVVFDCESAEQAIEYVQRNGPPDILFTDICMLQQSGLDLCRYFHERHAATYKVILTGHGEFEYAKQAIEFGVREYLLKPAATAAVHALLQQCTGELLLQRHSKQELEKFRGLVQSNRHNYIESLLADIVAAPDGYREKAFLPLAQELGFTLEGYYFFLVKYKIKEGTGGQLSHFLQLRAFLHEQLSLFGACYLFNLEYRKIGMVMIPDSPQHCPETLLKQTLDKAALFSEDITCSAGVSLPQRGFETLKTAHTQAAIACDYDFYFGPGSVTAFQPVFTKPGTLAAPRKDLNDSEIVAKLMVGNWQRATALLEKRLEEIRAEKAIHLGDLQGAAVELLTAIHKNIPQESPDASGDFFEAVQRLAGTASINEVEAVLVGAIEASGKAVQKSFITYSNEAVATILEYLNENYARQITLDDLSQLVYLNPKYICAIIKKDTGKTFYEILTEIRVRKAQELLRDPALKMYQISQMVGFYDTKAFTAAFKKITNITPTQHRGMVQNG